MCITYIVVLMMFIMKDITLKRNRLIYLAHETRKAPPTYVDMSDRSVVYNVNSYQTMNFKMQEICFNY